MSGTKCVTAERLWARCGWVTLSAMAGKNASISFCDVTLWHAPPAWPGVSASCKSKNEPNATDLNVADGARGQRKRTVTHLQKLAKFCITLAMSVSVREVRSAGYSCIRLNREGDMMAGHMKRRKREELMRLSARSSLPRSAHLARQEAKTSFSSRGNMLKRKRDFYYPLSRGRSKIKPSSLFKAPGNSAKSRDYNIW